MRLSKIKLAGFKSFVEPTTVSLPGSIVGIVGPNGCGKSNIIDAVRWVMGESSAKYLRGESMVDVIFNGSESRKPVGMASIELLFDNTDAAAGGGKYAAYNEISVRRQVNREGQSTYYFNGTRCRRRDITDVFLGTGLGPRSYSLIEQSMIARIIEARPEELRAHLEEAAGISLYKDRRKETERRMHDTLENLDRLDDIRNELGRQLDKLKRQAQAAERYRALKVKQRERQAQLYVLKLQALDDEQQLVRRELAAHEHDLEAQLDRQSALEHEVEDHRIRYAECRDRLNEIQARYYAVGSDIARVEQQIQHRRELRETNRQELEHNREALLEIERSFDQDQDKLSQLQARLQELVPAVAEAVAAEKTAGETLESMQRQLEQWRQRWDRFSEEAAQPVQTVQVERARIEQLEQRSHELAQRRQRLQEETERLIRDDPQAELERLAEREQILLEELDELQQRHHEQQAGIGERRERLAQLSDALDEIRETLHRDRARLTSLETIQQSALGEDETIRAWLRGLDLEGERRLAQCLDVEPGWEHAVETVLGPALQAVVMQGACPGEALSSPCTGAVMLFSPSSAETPARPKLALAPALRDKTGAPWALDDLLGHVYCVADLESARTLAASLDAHESVVTPEGIWLGRRWTRVRGTDNPDAGVIGRERELASLRAEVAVWQERSIALQSEQENLRSELTSAEADFDILREGLAERQRDLASVRAQSDSRRRRRDEIHQRRLELDRELAETTTAAQDASEAVCTARERLQEALTRGEALDRERVVHNEERQHLQAQLAAAQDQLNEFQAHRHDLTLQEQGAATARAALEESINRLCGRRERLLTRDAQIKVALTELDAPESELEVERERLAEEQHLVEEQLEQARRELGESEQRQRALEPQRVEIGQRVLELRQALESVRLREHELTIRVQSQAEQLGELGYEPGAVAAGLEPGLTEPVCAQDLVRLQEQITRLEPVNLAAIDECRVLEERKSYLEGQHADLAAALETLESAIRRIDQETRRRFKETFEQVDQRLRELFPRLFGGGQAHLELTGEDMLEAAITIMARPPGKKITSIHLLSSGEKALTAVSLVFALFELNPAPFCMLDEVDAPLDEANVGRFCDMLREQSTRVQFIMITHNKTSMQAASHLLGITMNEPGVSRLVAVDLAQAAELAAV